MSDIIKLVDPYAVVKFFTPDCFRRHEFVRLLRHNGVRAIALKDGILLDRTAFNAIPSGWLPVWAWLNKQDINDPLHTRHATIEEYRALALGGWGHESY